MSEIEKPNFEALRGLVDGRPTLLKWLDEYERLLSEADFKGGTVCPECGLRQSHLHLGWVVMPTPDTDVNDGILFTQVSCDACETDSLILRYFKDSDKSKLKGIDDVIWKFFGHDKRPFVHGCVSSC